MRIAAIAMVALLAGCDASPRELGRQLCTDSLRAASENPNNVSIGFPVFDPEMIADPKTGQYAASGRNQYIWNAGNLQLQNRFGALIGHSATCTTNAQGTKVDDLKID